MSCLHHIPGRIRVRVAGVKRNSPRARALADWLRSQDGVETAEVSPITGSALIHYRVGAMSPDSLLRRMRDEKWIGDPLPESTGTLPAAQWKADVVRPTRPRIESAIAGLIVQSLAGAVLERSLLALVAMVL